MKSDKPEHECNKCKYVCVKIDYQKKTTEWKCGLDGGEAFWRCANYAPAFTVVERK